MLAASFRAGTTARTLGQAAGGGTESRSESAIQIRQKCPLKKKSPSQIRREITAIRMAAKCTRHFAMDRARFARRDLPCESAGAECASLLANKWHCRRLQLRQAVPARRSPSVLPCS